jgi:predicted nucleic acid-binding protein
LIVVDTHLLAYAVLPGATTELVNRVAEIDPDWIAPALWRKELANVLATTMRVHGLALDEALVAFSDAERLVSDAEIVPAIAEQLEIAERGGVSAYDAEFVFVAERFDLALVTGDRKLARAFPGRAQSIAEFATG